MQNSKKGARIYKRKVALKYTEFKKNLDDGKISSIYLFEGEDAYFRERGLSLLKDKMLTEPDINFAVFNGDKLDQRELMSSLNAYPFLSQYRLTLIREFYPKKSELSNEFKAYLGCPIQNSVLIIVNEKPCEVFSNFNAVNVVDCSKSDATTISRWIKAKCISAGISIDLETANLLANYCGLDMTRVDNETEKLICYAMEQKLINRSDVESLVNKSTEYKIYQMTEFIGKRQFDDALLVIQDMLSKGETLQHILTSVYNYFRRLLHISISAKTDQQNAHMLGIKDFAVKKAREQSKLFTRRALKKAVDMLVDTDFLIKSGGVVDGDNRIWLTIFSIMTEGKPQSC